MRVRVNASPNIAPESIFPHSCARTNMMSDVQTVRVQAATEPGSVCKNVCVFVESINATAVRRRLFDERPTNVRSVRSQCVKVFANARVARRVVYSNTSTIAVYNELNGIEKLQTFMCRSGHWEFESNSTSIKWSGFGNLNVNSCLFYFIARCGNALAQTYNGLVCRVLNEVCNSVDDQVPNVIHYKFNKKNIL